MKHSRAILMLGSVCACMPAWALAAQVSTRSPAFWTGPYAGAEVGLNNSSIDNVNDSSSVSYSIGPYIGYNLAMPLSGLPSPLILGADVFATFNGQSDHLPHGADFGSHVYGMDALVGLPLGAQRRLMPYFKLGFGTLVGTGDLDGNGTNVRFGLGAEYKLQRNWGVVTQWMHEDAHNVTNDNFTVGVNYHFGGYY